MKQKINLLAVIVGILLMVSFISSGTGISAENKDKEIEVLNKKIEDLEKRIKDLESLLKAYHGPRDNKKAGSFGWLDKKSWRSLKKGMKQEDVKKILGEPVKSIDGSRTIWYYPNFYDGYVSFDENGKLTGWSEP